MPPSATLLAGADTVGTAGPLIQDDEFSLDLRVTESVSQFPFASSVSDDNCGSTCDASACVTASSDPS